jgi:hypothetical protein
MGGKGVPAPFATEGALGEVDGKGQQDPWHEGAALLGNKLAVHPAHVRKQLEETMAAQIADASAKFEATARAVTAKASQDFFDSFTKITADLSQRHGATERNITEVKQRTTSLEEENFDLKAAVARLDAIATAAEARAPALNLDGLGTWDRDPDPTTF